MGLCTSRPSRRIGVSGLVCGFIALAGSPAGGQVIYSDDFDADTSADWVVISSGDSAVTFAFDYSSLGIPPAPGSTTTRALRLAAHVQPTFAVHAVTVASNFRIAPAPSLQYRLEFYAWQNHTNLIPTPNGSGTTHYLTGGVGHDGAANNFAGNATASGPTPNTGAGAWFAGCGDGGATRDFVAFEKDVEQLATLIPNPYLQGTQSGSVFPLNNAFPQRVIGAINGGAVAAAQGLSPSAVTPTGSLGFAWRRWVVEVSGDSATWSIDGLPIARVTDDAAGPVSLAGAISLGYMDIFNSPTGLPSLHFGLIDNLTVTLVPEPTSTLMAAAATGVLLPRRRRVAV